MSHDEAEELILEVFNDWSHDDPEWWHDMVEAVMDCGTAERARGFLQTGVMP